jgi:hypothetical protein
VRALLRVSPVVTAVTAVVALTAVTGIPAASAQSASAGSAARLSAPAVVLINQPAARICVGHTFTVGVWFQQLSGGSRAYRIAVSGPRHRRFFYRHGTARSSSWRFWKIRAGRRGKYRTLYFSHRPGSAKWSKYTAMTRARRCTVRSA